MKETIVLDNYLKKDREEVVFDFQRYVAHTGGKIITQDPTNPTDDSVSLIEVAYGDWKVMLGSAASVMSDGEAETMHYICRSIIDITNGSSVASEYCAYYGEWDPEDGDTITFCSDNGLVVSLSTLRDFHKLISSGNLLRGGDECPFAGTGIKHKELVHNRILVPHAD